MDEIVALCRRRGFIFQSSEIYGGINGFWDYGPLGTLLKRNLKDAWWQDMVERELVGPDGNAIDMVSVDTTIIGHSKTWEASGHLAGFSDSISMCKFCKKMTRVDQWWGEVKDSKWFTSLMGIYFADPAAGPDQLMRWAHREGKKLVPNLALVRNPEVTLTWLAQFASALSEPTQMAPEELVSYLATEQLNQTGLRKPCPHCGGELTDPKPFNLMFSTHVGAVADEDNIAWLRPETAQGIFTNFWNIVDTSRVKVPFGIAQQGKAFRNEVTPRNFTFRSREFEQMEIEFFIHPSQANEWYAFWRDTRYQWWQSIGLTPGNLQLREHARDELAHYAKEGAGTSDIEYRFPFTAPGFGELEGVAHRADYDLKAHATACGKGDKMKYFDQERQVKMQSEGASKDEINEKSRYFPHVIEPSAGADRGTLALLCEAFTPTPDRAGSKFVMNFHPRMAPIKAAVFPLVAKDGMPEVAEKLYKQLRKRWNIDFDVKQSIGKRYARMDEAGTPFCITIDGDSLTNHTVTVRHRDTATQETIAIDKVESFLEAKIDGVQ